MKVIAMFLYGPAWLSWLTTIVGSSVFFALFFVVFRATRSLGARKRWSIRGSAFGAAVLPLAVWLYAQFFTGPLRALVLGFPGLVLLAHFLPIMSPAEVSHGIVLDTAAGAAAALGARSALAALFWAAIYGVMGYFFGVALEWRRRRVQSA